MIHKRFQEVLKRSIGLDVSSVGPTAVSRAVQHRARDCEIESLELYLDKVLSDRAELQALVETVVVPETWFYRAPEAFSAMAAMLLKAWPLRSPRDPFRLLSLPCSTGEEPCTMAMALIDAGLPPAAFSILAIDISNGALQRARSGIYERNSFRGSDLAYRDRHFSEIDTGFRIADEVLRSIRYSQGNLFELSDLPDGSFDVVFCRNLLIYFDLVDQSRAAAQLRRLVDPEGTLFVGHSETRVVIDGGFAPLRIPGAFAFRKALPPQDKVISTIARASRSRSAPPAPANANRATAERRPRGTPRAKPSSRAASTRIPPTASTKLSDIRAVADRGDLKAAAQLAEGLLKETPAATEVLHLLGVINDAAGDHRSAAEYYRKTLYLDPNHHEALTHLALLLDRLGDAVGAARMRERARRIDARRDG